MADEICTDVQITKLISNSREPIIVETKTTTTTTTTTVTKRICIANDANIDLTDIQSLLEIKENPQTKTIQSIAPLNADDTSKNAVTFSKDRRTTTVTNLNKDTLKEKPNDSFLSSTKIESSNEVSELSRGKEEFDKLQSFSPNLSNNKVNPFFENKDKNKMAKEKSATNEPKTVRSSVRTKKMTNQSNSNNDNNYIDGLINEYMTLEKNPRRKQSKKREKEQKKEDTKIERAPIESKDLSAIFELSTEIESPLRSRVPSLSPIAFDGMCNDDYDIGPVENPSDIPDASELPIDDVLKENKKSKRKISKVNRSSGDSETSKKRTRISKKLPKTSKTKNASSVKHTEPSGRSSNENHSPIKIYSPSTRGKLRTGTDNRLVLTKKMIEKKLQKHPETSKMILQRLGRSNEMTIDADARLIYYPNEIDESKNEVANDTDILSVLQKRSKPLLVKEIHCTE